MLPDRISKHPLFKEFRVVNIRGDYTYYLTATFDEQPIPYDSLNRAIADFETRISEQQLCFKTTRSKFHNLVYRILLNELNNTMAYNVPGWPGTDNLAKNLSAKLINELGTTDG